MVNLEKIRKQQLLEMRLIANRLNTNKDKHIDGTCFAGFEKVCSESFTPNIKKADKLRTQQYW